MKRPALRIAALTIGVVIAAVTAAQAFPHRGGFVVAPRVEFYRPFFSDPFWGPWYPRYTGPIVVGSTADIRTDVTPKGAGVYVDGYYAGQAGDFDGVFKHLPVTPGGHVVTFYLEGFRTITENVYARPDSTLKIDQAMDRLPAGEASAPIPTPRWQLRAVN